MHQNRGMTRTSPSALFFQGGPGQNAEIERAWLTDLAPIEFWESPRYPADHPDAFGDWIIAAETRLRDHASTQPQGRSAIIAWSFAGHLVRELAQRHPDLISSITLLGSTWDAWESAATLAERLIERGVAPSTLSTQAAQARAKRDIPSYWELVGALLQVPGFARTHWAPRSSDALKRYESLAAQATPVLDPGTFASITNSFLSRPRDFSPPSPFLGRVRGFWGTEDPFLDPDQEARAWMSHFPTLEPQRVACGHYVHLEVAPKVWMPTLSN